MKNILLTGSGGFIGAHIKRQLNSYNLFCPRSFELDLLDKFSVEKYINENNINYIIHCASCGVRILPDATIDDIAMPNIKMFKNLASFVSENCPMITIGSGAEYDKTLNLNKVKESDFAKSIPKDAYGYSKYLISKEIETRENILNLRLFGVFGYNEHKTRVTSCIINDYINKNPILLNQNVVFDFIYIDDFCRILEYFINNKTDEKFINVTPTKSIEILELANIVNSFSNYKCEIIFKQNGYNKEYTGDNSKLLSIIKDFKFTSYENGLKDMYLYFINKKENR